jgi:hypothetical protein
VGGAAFAVALVAAMGCGRLGFDDRVVADAPPFALTFASTCALRSHVLISDGLPIDDAAAHALSESISTACGIPHDRSTVMQDAAGVLDPVTGRPLIAPTSLTVIGGGDVPQRAMRYLLLRDTPLAWTTPAPMMSSIVVREDGRVVASGPISATHDYLMLFVVTEPIGGSHVVSAQGALANGTTAAGIWFSTRLAPTLASSSNTWAVVEWTDTDAVMGASTGDTYVVLGEGD